MRLGQKPKRSGAVASMARVVRGQVPPAVDPGDGKNLGTSEGHSLHSVEFELFRDTFITHKFSCRSKAG